MRLNPSNSFKNTCTYRPRRKGQPPEPPRPRFTLRRAIWLAMIVVVLVVGGGNVMGWFIEVPEAHAPASFRKPAKQRVSEMQSKIQVLFGPRPGQRLAG